MKDAVLVSHEMTTLVGSGTVPDAALPDHAVVFSFSGFADGASATLSYRPDADLADLSGAPLILVVAREACQRIFATEPAGAQTWHLPNGLRSLALSLIDCEAEGEARTTLRLARSIELLCQVHAALRDQTLVAMEGDCSLSEMDIARIAQARRIIDQRWQEKLTVPVLAQHVGVNRDKLMRGFRQLYGATIAEILAERRLSEARNLLLGSDLPVASVAYRCSYLNNASFTRAFTRRFGLAPTEMRRIGVAA